MTALIVLSITQVSLSQRVYIETFSEFFYGRQPSARAEALGRSYVAIDNDLSSTFYNPAGIAALEGISISGSYARPYYYLLEDAYYNYFAAAYTFPKYGVIAVSRFYFSYNYEFVRYSSPDIVIGKTNPDMSLYSVSIASGILKVINIGVNANLFQYNSHYSGIQNDQRKNTINSYTIDIGLVKNVSINLSENVSSQLKLGSSLYNITTAKFDFYYLPVSLRLGAAYSIVYENQVVFPTMKTIQLTLVAEYQNLLNSKYRTTLSSGLELSCLEILSARIGYYSQSLNDYGLSTNSNAINSVTYGIGVHLPLSAITTNAIPISLKFDYTSLPQPVGNKSSQYVHLKNFSVTNLSLNYLP